MKHIKVENMNCQNCVGKIQRALLLKDIVNQIDLSKKEVTVSDDKYLEAIDVIENAGYKTVK
ncbi:MAG: heavy-metal-associated domain-containing protein [Candidatus Phytoplasma sp.]|nr:heavy-metal-associated domain-containing protein [Phytoplasma sp.]